MSSELAFSQFKNGPLFENTDISPFGFFRVLPRTGSVGTEKQGNRERGGGMELGKVPRSTKKRQ